MKNKRMIALCILLLAMFAGLGARIGLLSRNGIAGYGAAAEAHGTYTVRLGQDRGIIYDRSMQPLVNLSYVYMAAVSPAQNTAAQLMALLPHVKDDDALQRQMREGRLFSVQVDTDKISAEGVKIVKIPVRYNDEAIAPHLLGYVSGDGEGVTGIEKAYNDRLEKDGGEITASVSVDALGRTLPGLPVVIRSAPSGEDGVVLTLDKSIQIATRQACLKHLKAGAAVVMDAQSGDILALASVPEFSQTDVAGSINGKNSPLLNRAFSTYDLGSVFKITLCAAALESGVSPSFSYNCTGKIDVAGKNFNCHKLTGHGIQNMTQGLSNSCNTYFINLGQILGGDKILSMAARLGFGQATQLAPGIKPSAGVMPSSEGLRIPAALANFSMGQGEFMATPIQVARMMCAVANGGILPGVRLVKGMCDENGKMVEALTGESSKRVFSQAISQTLQQFLIETVDVGTGMPAKPEAGGAGGKTATAQTGWKQNGVLIDEAWFAGFYPAKNPKYVIVVLAENGDTGGSSAGPVFKDIADYLAPSCGYTLPSTK